MNNLKNVARVCLIYLGQKHKTLNILGVRAELEFYRKNASYPMFD